MSAFSIIFTILFYFLLLIIVSFLTSRNNSKESFFTGDKKSPWYLVAYGMIGASLSGVTFISIPGKVGEGYFTYFIIVIGYVLGYIVIAEVLLPLYYRKKLISIYTYLEDRFGNHSYKTGASFFIFSRVVGASFRLFLVASVLQAFIFSNPIFFKEPIPFWVSVLTTVLLIWVYTFQGGIKTIVWTDTLQTTFMIGAVILCIFSISSELHESIGETVTTVLKSDYSNILMNSKTDANIFQFLLTGMFITIVMTGLDQDMMQKNLTINSLKDAKKNVYFFSGILVIVNFIFLFLGALLYVFANEKGIQIPERPDDLFPILALDHFGTFAGILFLLGVTSAAYSSADSALTALTTSFSIDILNKNPQKLDKKLRYLIHFSFSILLFLVILFFDLLDNRSVIDKLFTAAGYTYGPLLGLYSFGLFTKLKINDRMAPYVCIYASILSYFLNTFLVGNALYDFGFTILLVNGSITFLGLWLASEKFRFNHQRVMFNFALVLLASLIANVLIFNFDYTYDLILYRVDGTLKIDGIQALGLTFLYFVILFSIDFILTHKSFKEVFSRLYRTIISVVSLIFLLIVSNYWTELAKVNGIIPMLGYLLLGIFPLAYGLKALFNKMFLD